MAASGTLRKYARTSPPTGSRRSDASREAWRGLKTKCRQNKTPACAGVVFKQRCHWVSERDAPAVERAHVTGGDILHAQLPGAVQRFGGQVDRVGRNHVVGAVAAAAGLEGIDAAIRSQQVDLKVAAVGVGDVDGHLAGGRRITR